jgi:hypothetical protein
MLKSAVNNLLGRFGLAVHRTSSIERLMRGHERLRARLSDGRSVEPPAPARRVFGGDDALPAAYAEVREALDWYEERQNFFRVTEDYDARAKEQRIVDGIADFGQSDFADLACWIFASALANHRVVHQRIDETTTLWRAVKHSGGPILEVGRAAGGSTIAILGASGDRQVVSIDRGPFHAQMAERIFSRPDVRRRLKLYTQSSREPIAENEFGMIFIDADHSYEGVCHDIATFWNSLKSFDGKPPMAVFHDAASNPITFVKPVKRACDELLAEPGVASVVESWGSMLALEKRADIDADRWYAKEDKEFWTQFATEFAIPPAARRPAVHKAAVNFINQEGLDDPSWIKDGITVDRVYAETDNPVRFVREASSAGRHAIEKTVDAGPARLGLTAFVRPVQLRRLRLAIYDSARRRLAHADFEFGAASRMLDANADGVGNILDTGFRYGNGFFRCELAAAFAPAVASVIVAVEALGPTGESTYPGDPERGFLMNLASLREVL